ncbi:MAG TPA: EsaB/YukD family protein [Clostridia bacterium]|nr:EsaB/YukD family protein [Clostridia bacterium]
MDKISVEVLIPVAGRKYDFLLPSSMKIYIVRELIAQAAREEEQGGLAFNAGTVLCSRDKGRVLDEQSTLEQEDIGDGNQLLLI